MSKQLQPVKYTKKQQENNWINNIYSSHDLFCGCSDPLLHLLKVLNRSGNAPKPEEEINNIKCLITGDDTIKEEGAGISTQELEDIFADITGEKEDNPGTSEG